ncbi:CPBP family intramembrane glutamic endopeptidase [Rhizosphaericola mali]|uniref:CPBP family intramembrane metalloprotease n=1 Tax=Rhizosphaericola mali TaxID=2545455 RepID=A0A5P2G2P8_9BACT|nr:CPBP family intramembrane glutamic endopeptidase [Rhizosphaericola mali]QES90066.1 CPBP family intramembrane metalloprotease [Rhizosphaericola mali]
MEINDLSPEKSPSGIPKNGEIYTPAGQFGILFGTTIACLILGTFIAIIPFLVKGVSFVNVGTAMFDPKYANAARLAQTLSTICMFLFPALILTANIKKKPVEYFHLNAKSSVKTWQWLVLIVVCSFAVTGLMGDINQWIPIPKNWATYFQGLEDAYYKEVFALMQMHGIGDLIVSILLVAALPAFLEELYFRGSLQSVFVKWFKNPHVAIIVSSIIFSAIHGSYYGFLPRFFLGIALGYIYYWGKDIKLNMFLHFINNTVSVIGIYTLSVKHELTKEKMDESFPWYIGIMGLLVFLYAFFQFKKTVPQTNNL